MGAWSFKRASQVTGRVAAMGQGVHLKLHSFCPLAQVTIVPPGAPRCPLSQQTVP